MSRSPTVHRSPPFARYGALAALLCAAQVQAQGNPTGGQVTPPANPHGITAAPTPLSFVQPVHQAAGPRTAVVTNLSGAGVGFVQVKLSPPGLFTVDVPASSCFGTVVPHGGSCTVQFRPLPQPTAGQRQADFSMLTVNFGLLPVASVLLQLTVLPAPPAPPPPAPAPSATPAPSPVGLPPVMPPGNRLVSVSPGRILLAGAGTTSRTLGYQFLAGPMAPLAAWVCTRLVTLPVHGVSVGDPCAPGSRSGVAVPQPGPYAAQPGASGSRASETVVFPEAMARLSAELARRGGDGTLYFVRQFAHDAHAVVALQAAADSIAAPLVLTDVRMAFHTARGPQGVVNLAPGETPPPSSAEIHYTGSGTLRGRWEVVQPGQPVPTAADLRPEAGLAPAERAAQRRWQPVERFEQVLSPGGRFTLPGPDPSRLPTGLAGGHLLLLRIEPGPAVGPGAVPDGAAPFSTPVLVYRVGTDLGADAALGSRFIDLVPAPPGLGAEGPVIAWKPLAEATHWRVELADAEGSIVGSKLLRAEQTAYELAGALAQQTLGRATRWRVLAFSGTVQVGRSEWRDLS